MALLVDTGPLYALADRADAHYERVRRFWRNNTDLLLVPHSVLPEACYLIEWHLGPEAGARLLDSFVRGELRGEALTLADVQRSAELIRLYADSGLGFVDASLVAMAERLNITRILTLDVRHFGQVRPRHCQAFELLPS